MRVNIRNNETISSVINFINPWEHEKQRQIFSGITLENMLEVKTRTESQKRVRRLFPVRIHKIVKKKQIWEKEQCNTNKNYNGKEISVKTFFFEINFF